MKKKIIIFTSSGGGGHTAATAALKSYFADEFDVKSVYIFSEVLGPIDPGQIVSFHAFTGERLYNFFIKKKWNYITNFMYRLGKWYFKLTRKKNQQLIIDYLKKEKPDLVISVAPLINADILACAKKLSIPFVLTPTDLDAQSFIPGIKNPSYQQFRCTLAFDDQELKQTLAPAKIPDNLLPVTGFPIRCNFFEEKNIPKLKKDFDVEQNKPVILLLMGAIGINEIIPFVQQLIRLSFPVHLLICVGKNENLKNKINKLPFPPHISHSIIGFTERISDLMAIADLLITKSGTVSFCEGIYMNVPILLDGTSHVLAWEQFNHDFVLKHGFGDVIKKRNNIPFLVQNLFSNPETLERMKKNLQTFPKKNGCEEIKKLVRTMLS